MSIEGTLKLYFIEKKYIFIIFHVRHLPPPPPPQLLKKYSNLYRKDKFGTSIEMYVTFPTDYFKLTYMYFFFDPVD